MTIDEWNDKKATVVEKIAPEDAIVEEPARFKNEVSSNGPDTETDVKPVEDTGEASSAAKIGLVLGVLSIVLGVFFAGAPWIGILTGTAAIVMGAVERKKSPASHGPATGALVCGIVGVSLSVAFGIVFGILGIALKILTGIFKWVF